MSDFKGWNYYNSIEFSHLTEIHRNSQFKVVEWTSGNTNFDAVIVDLKNNLKKLECKTDFMSKKYSAVAIEFKNSYNKPSGIYNTEAELWSHTYYWNNSWHIGIVSVEAIKSLIRRLKELHKHKVKFNNKNGDSNCFLFIIDCKDWNRLIEKFGLKIKINKDIEDWKIQELKS